LIGNTLWQAIPAIPKMRLRPVIPILAVRQSQTVISVFRRRAASARGGISERRDFQISPRVEAARLRYFGAESVLNHRELPARSRSKSSRDPSDIRRMDPAETPRVLQYSRSSRKRRWKAVLLAFGFALIGCLFLWKKEHAATACSYSHYAPLALGM
jgi:hypothetical protein